MLTYFPTPYPDEWWYSVLCRYHVRSGWTGAATTLQELYGESRLNPGILFPDIDCYAIIKQIPSNVFSLKEILLEHTLMPYYLRFCASKKREETLNSLLSGGSIKTGNIHLKTPDGKQGMKFCPLCYAEDVEIYGEPYWHREHQIPLMPICPKHKVRLHLFEIPLHRLTKSFFPLCEIPNIENMAQDDVCLSWELSLADALFSILTLPFEIGPPQGYNNLENVLQSKGYVAYTDHIKKFSGIEKLRQQCTKFFGKNIGRQYFAKLSHNVICRICKWELILPERYALLSVFVGISIKELFGKEIQSIDPMVKKLLKYRDSGIPYEREELAQLVGISSKQMDSLANRYNIVPFWTRQYTEYPETIELFLTADEKQRILVAASAYGSSDGEISIFVKTILLQEVKRILDEQNKEKYVMKCDIKKDQTAFIAASLIALADMSVTELQDLVELTGVEVIREFLNMQSLRFELSYQEMAEEICVYIGWEPALSPLHLTTHVLDKLGDQIADLICQSHPTKETDAERVFSVLCSEDVKEMISASGEACSKPATDKIELVW